MGPGPLERALVNAASGYNNKLKAKLTQQINDLVRRWED